MHSVEAGPAGPVLAGPLFSDLMKFIIDISKKIMHVLHMHLLQLDHFKSPSYAPDV